MQPRPPLPRLLPLRRVPLLSALLLAACGDATGARSAPDPEPPGESAARVTLAGVEQLRPGARATLVGTNLSRIERLSVGDSLVQLEAGSDARRSFTVPVFRACETDGRPVALVADDSIRLVAALEVAGTVEMAPGEVRVLSAEELSCLQIGGATGDYLLAVVSLTDQPVMDQVFTLTAYGATDAPLVVAALAPAPPSPWAPSRSRHPPDLGRDRLPSRLDHEWGLPHVEGPWDPRYATAGVGDTLSFIDWSALAALLEPGVSLTREQIPTYAAVVVAVAGEQVIVVDLRVPDPGRFFTDEVRASMHTAAEIADRYTLPAIRAVLFPDFEPPQGAGGRRFAIIEASGSVGGISAGELGPKSRIPVASEVMVATITADYGKAEFKGREGLIGRTIIHEMAHLAEIWFPSGSADHASSTGWYVEAVAVGVEEVAARLAGGREEGADDNAIETAVPGLALFEWPSSVSELASPWDMDGFARSLAAYDIGARILLFAREQLDESGFSPEAPVMHQRLLSRVGYSCETEGDCGAVNSPWSIHAVAAELGLSMPELLSAYMIAELTDDLVPSSAGLFQIRSWDNKRPQNSPENYWRIAASTPQRARNHIVLRNETRQIAVQVPGGSHHHWFLPNDGDLGTSILFSNVEMKNYHRVWLVRLR